MEILENLAEPIRVGSRGSKYLTTEQLAFVNTLEVNQSTLVPFLPGVPAVKQASSTKTVLKNYVDGKEFVVWAHEQGIAVKRKV